LTRCRARAAAVIALASLLILAGPVLADEDDKADIAEAELTLVQEQEREVPGYYEDQALSAQKRSVDVDREAASYYDEQARRAKKRAEEMDQEAAKYYGERE
jgi:hypothetical protein